MTYLAYLLLKNKIKLGGKTNSKPRFKNHHGQVKFINTK